MSEELPKGWVESTLDEVCAYPQYGWTTKASKTGKIYFLRTTDITSGPINWNDVPFCHEEPYNLNKYLLNDGDIVISRAGSIGVSSLIKNPAKSVFASYLIRFRPLINPSYLAYFLQSSRYWKNISELSSGIALQNVNASKLRTITLPLPPLNGQKRIVAKIEELFSNLDAGVKALEKAKALLKQYRQSVLKAAVTGELTKKWREKNKAKLEPASKLLDRILKERRKKWEEAQLADFKRKGITPKDDKWKEKYQEPASPDTSSLPELPEGWVWINLEILATDEDNSLKAGPFGSSLKKSMYSKAGYKIYGQEQVIRNDHRYGDYYVDRKLYEELESCAIKPGDMLISLVGTIGRVLILPKDCEPGIINPRLVKVSLDNKLVLSKYVQIYLQAPQVKHLFKIASHGGTMEILNLGIIRKIPVALPPLHEQHVLIEEYEELLSRIKHIEQSVFKVEPIIKSLRQSILKKAFEGKLVPQNPDDEPASELLKRIQAEREKGRDLKRNRESHSAKPRKQAKMGVR